MANNEKIKERFESEKQVIDELVAMRDQLFEKRDNITSFGLEKREAIRVINDQITELNNKLREIGRKLEDESASLPEELKKTTKIKGKKDLVKYEINGEKLTAHVAVNSKGKFNNIVLEMNLNNKLLAYFKENVTIKEDGIVSQFKIDEEAVLCMSLEEKLKYYNELCAKISNPDIVKEPAKSITLGKRYCIVNECDLDIYIEILNRYKTTLIEFYTAKNDYTRLQAANIFAGQAVKISDVELSKFRIDWNFVNSLESLEKRAEYFNNLAKEIAAAPKTEPTRVPLGKSYAIVNKCDEMLFLQCFTEFSNATRAIKASKNPSYTIDWEYVNSLDSAMKKAEYFEDLCGKIDSVEKFKTVTITFRGRTFTINEVDAAIFSQAMQEFEKNYLQAIKDEKQAEIARIEEERIKEEQARLEQERLEQEEKARKDEEARLEQERLEQEEKARKDEEARLEQERLEQEEKARKDEEARLEQERVRQAIAEAKRLEQEEKAARELAYKEDMEKLERLARIEDEQHKQERDSEDEEYHFINGSGIGDVTRDKEDQTPNNENKGKEIPLDAESVLDRLNNMGSSDGSDIDFFDDDDDEYEEDREKEEQTQSDETKEEETAREEDIHTVASDLGGTVDEIGGLQVINLSPTDTDLKDEKKDESDKVDDKAGDKDKHSLRDWLKGKIGKKKNKVEDKKMDTYEIPTKADAIDIEITDGDALKVLASRGFIGNISSSKLYTTRKELYLLIMDWIEDQKITNKVTIATKRHTTEIDAKYEDIYTFISNKYEKLEDKYEKIANDPYHNLKVKLSLGTAGVACGVILLLTAGKGLFVNQTATDEVNAIKDYIKYEVEQDSEGSLINTAGYDTLSKVNAIIMESEEEMLEDDDDKKTLEDTTLIPTDPSSSRGEISYSETSTYNYAGTNATEAFNMDPTQLGISEEDATEEIKRAAESNKVPLLELVR